MLVHVGHYVIPGVLASIQGTGLAQPTLTVLVRPQVCVALGKLLTLPESHFLPF